MESKPSESTPPEYFEDLYAKREDPWAITWSRSIRNAFSGKFYEQRRYWRLLRIIPKKRYLKALEIGCSIGVFTKALARRCQSLVAIDYSPMAIAFARKRCRRETNIEFQEAMVPAQFPEQRFDLIVYSEVAYYQSVEDFRLTVAKIVQNLMPGGYLVMIHYRHHQDVPLPGESAHDLIIAETKGLLLHLRDWRNPAFYRLDLFQKPEVAG